jgi:hypothetical protein
MRRDIARWWLLWLDRRVLGSSHEWEARFWIARFFAAHQRYCRRYGDPPPVQCMTIEPGP